MHHYLSIRIGDYVRAPAGYGPIDPYNPDVVSFRVHTIRAALDSRDDEVLLELPPTDAGEPRWWWASRCELVPVA